MATWPTLRRRFMKALQADYPEFEHYSPGTLLRKPNPSIVQYILLDGISKHPGLVFPGVAWSLIFDDLQEIGSFDCIFGLKNTYDKRDKYSSPMPRATEAEAIASLEIIDRWVRGEMIPLLDRFDSIEKLVAAYDAETDFTPAKPREAPSRFASRAGCNFSLSMCWRRYNLAHAMASVGRVAEGVAHLEAMLRDFPAKPHAEFQVRREERARDLLTQWRAKLAERA